MVFGTLGPGFQVLSRLGFLSALGDSLSNDRDEANNEYEVKRCEADDYNPPGVAATGVVHLDGPVGVISGSGRRGGSRLAALLGMHCNERVGATERSSALDGVANVHVGVSSGSISTERFELIAVRLCRRNDDSVRLHRHGTSNVEEGGEADHDERFTSRNGQIAHYGHLAVHRKPAGVGLGDNVVSVGASRSGVLRGDCSSAIGADSNGAHRARG